MQVRGGSGRGAARSSTARGSRASLSRPSSRGGIQKRRGDVGPLTDRDGDLDMCSTPGPSSRGTRGRGGLSHRGAARRAVQTVINRHLNSNESDAPPPLDGVRIVNAPFAPARSSELQYLRVHGLKQSKAASNQGGGCKELLRFLERKATSASGGKRQVSIKKKEERGEYVYVGATPEDAVALLALNGWKFAGATLEIIESSSPPLAPAANADGRDETVPSAKETRAKLQAILSTRYVGDAKLLKLDFLAQDPGLTELGMFRTRERAQKTFHVFMVICDGLFKTRRDKQNSVESISIANNGIDNVTQVESLADTFPDLKNLELSNNQLANMDALTAWAGKLRFLQTIHVAGNPLVVNQPDYKDRLMAWFPRLQDIDGVQVRTPEQVQAAVAATKPRLIPQHGPDFRDANGIGEGFLLEFFQAYDADRNGLLAKYYDDSTTFSLAVDTNAVRARDAPPPLPWAPYIKFSRNMLKVSHPSTRMQRLFRGRSVIADLWKQLPMTKHPDIKQELQKYIMDCHILPGLVDPAGLNPKGVDGMIIVVHGEFDELVNTQTGATGKRSFSRSFILGPGALGSPIPIRVVSDMLSLRAANQLPNVHNLNGAGNAPAAAANVPDANAPAAPAVPAAPGAAPQEAHRSALVLELALQTGMNPAYSEMCLAEVGWDVARGVVMFNEKRPQLPAEAFMQPN